MKCVRNTYEIAKNSGWIKKAPISIGSIYEILSESEYDGSRNFRKEYEIIPDYKIDWNERYAKIRGVEPEYSFYAELFEEPTEEEVRQYLRDNKINKLINKNE